MSKLRRLFAFSLVLLPALAGGAFLVADEGLWLPEQIAGFDWPALEARGLELEAAEIWDGERGLLSAAVNLGGCSAGFVSPAGLILTNHHCGYGAIAAHSTVERNLLRDGFVAATTAEELPARGMRVSIVTGYEDVTEAMHAAIEAAGADPAARKRAADARRRELERAEDAAGGEAQVVPYFEGRVWRLIHRTVFRDVRLVYAPPAAIGEFGGEEDNWMWPRHTGDFSFFRAYVAPDGTPAAYAEENVPYRPERWLEVSAEGVDEGDLLLILGYPGRTERYLSSLAVDARASWTYPMRERLLGAIIAGIEQEAAAAGDPAVELRARARIKGLANGYKNAQGMVWGLARNRVYERKLAEEEAFRAWVAGDAGRRARYGDVLERLLELDTRELERQERDFLLDSLTRYSVLARMGQAAARRLAAGKDSAGEELARELERLAEQLWPEAERRLFELVLEELRLVPEGERPAGSAAVLARGTQLVDESVLLDRSARAEAGALAADAIVRWMEALAPDLAELAEFRERQAGARMEVGALWIQAQEEWRGRRFYPDANGTLRVSVAAVKGYQPRDGVWHLPHTTVQGLVDKHRGVEPFDAPAALLAAAAQAAAAAVPTCFLADGDTTGGNSGSPVVDGRGRLVGLNFDRVFENVAGDYGWNPERSRNICVDVRYILWLLAEVYPAPRLLAEMGVE